MRIQHNSPKTIGGGQPGSKDKVSKSGLPGLGKLDPRVVPKRIGGN